MAGNVFLSEELFLTEAFIRCHFLSVWGHSNRVLRFSSLGKYRIVGWCISRRKATKSNLETRPFPLTLLSTKVTYSQREPKEGRLNKHVIWRMNIRNNILYSFARIDWVIRIRFARFPQQSWRIPYRERVFSCIWRDITFTENLFADHSIEKHWPHVFCVQSR